ncbi:YHYH protein [Zobellia uliginosa]|uniref:YHYH protein n=1 Tax=Zobellia uliginosa TaxID=143224 RepID=UPI001C0748B2|nr:YHYH protein [Zobellia uliginosa]MBU2945356.1 YHYH protein [Zobellia uliginosa]
MIKFNYIFGFLTVISLHFGSCSSDDTTDSDTDTETDTETATESGDYLITEAAFNSTSLVSFETVTATLEDGTSAECFQMTFSSNPVESGPFCPETINDIGGLGVYDGDTNPGFQVMKAELFNAMEADGYDIVDDEGNINIDDFASGPVDGDLSYCLEAAPDNNLQLTFLIPTTPKLASSNNDIDTIELVGVSIDGAPINGAPPSVANPGREKAGNIPSLDPCGGHHDPAGYYHWHFVAETMNQVLEANNITDVSCTLVEQVVDTKLIGFAKDGFPIYAYGVEPDDLDDCGGRTAATTDYPDGTYHYVASNTDAPNVPKCLKGVAASNSFSYR